MIPSLKPATLATADYPVALKPSLGYEKKLYVSFDQHTDLGTVQIVALNSGVVNSSVANTAILATVPQEIAAMLDDSYPTGNGQDLVLTVPVTYADNTTGSGTATFAVPAYAQNRSRNFRKGYAVQLAMDAPTKLVKAVNFGGITVAGDSGAIGAVIRLVGCPTLDGSSSGTFTLLGFRVKLDYDPRVPMPVAIQDGRDKGAAVKAGEIEVGSLGLSFKLANPMDGVNRFQGRKVTCWVKDLKEDKLHVQNILFLGTYITAKPSNSGGAEPETWEATAMFELNPFIVAQ